MLEETTRGLRDPRKHQKELNLPLGLLLPRVVLRVIVPQQRLPLLPPPQQKTHSIVLARMVRMAVTGYQLPLERLSMMSAKVVVITRMV